MRMLEMRNRSHQRIANTNSPQERSNFLHTICSLFVFSPAESEVKLVPDVYSTTTSIHHIVTFNMFSVAFLLSMIVVGFGPAWAMLAADVGAAPRPSAADGYSGSFLPAAKGASEHRRPTTAHKIIAVGDLHGSATNFSILWQKLCREAYPTPDGNCDSDSFFRHVQVIFLGDYNDKHMQTREVIDLLVRIKQDPRWNPDHPPRFLCGNHDYMMSAFLRRLGTSRDELNRIAATDPEAARFLANLDDATGYPVVDEHGAPTRNAQTSAPLALDERERSFASFHADVWALQASGVNPWTTRDVQARAERPMYPWVGLAVEEPVDPFYPTDINFFPGGMHGMGRSWLNREGRTTVVSYFLPYDRDDLVRGVNLPQGVTDGNVAGGLAAFRARIRTYIAVFRDMDVGRHGAPRGGFLAALMEASPEAYAELARDFMAVVPSLHKDFYAELEWVVRIDLDPAVWGTDELIAVHGGLDPDKDAEEQLAALADKQFWNRVLQQEPIGRDPMLPGRLVPLQAKFEVATVINHPELENRAPHPPMVFKGHHGRAFGPNSRRNNSPTGELAWTSFSTKTNDKYHANYPVGVNPNQPRISPSAETMLPRGTSARQIAAWGMNCVESENVLGVDNTEHYTADHVVAGAVVGVPMENQYAIHHARTPREVPCYLQAGRIGAVVMPARREDRRGYWVYDWVTVEEEDLAANRISGEVDNLRGYLAWLFTGRDPATAGRWAPGAAAAGGRRRVAA